MNFREISWRHFDFWLLGAVALLTIFGVTMIRSAIAGNTELIESNTVQKQIIFAVTGFVVMMLVAVMDYRLLSALSRPLYFLTAGLLAALNVVGGALFGSARWFRLGPMRMQPSEFMKLAYVLVLARCLMYTDEHRRLRGLAVPFLIALVPMALILKQPDLGTAMVFLPVLFVVLAVAGARRRHLVAIALMGALSLPVFWQVGLINNYQKARILGFIYHDDPQKIRAVSDRLGVRFDTYQQTQSVLTIGSGRLVGRGWGRGTQTRYDFIPEDHTDFIFTVIAEEAGFLGATLVPLAYLVMGLFGLEVARPGTLRTTGGGGDDGPHRDPGGDQPGGGHGPDAGYGPHPALRQLRGLLAPGQFHRRGAGHKRGDAPRRGGGRTGRLRVRRLNPTPRRERKRGGTRKGGHPSDKIPRNDINIADFFWFSLKRPPPEADTITGCGGVRSGGNPATEGSSAVPVRRNGHGDGTLPASGRPSLA